MSAIIRNGTVYDGNGTAPVHADVLIDDDGKVGAVGPNLEAPADAEVTDASNCWVTPGFLDIHTHYDAELEIHPALSESLRHGVTTTLIGSCGLSLVVGEPEDLADMFCRVEGIPRDIVLPLLEEIVDWKSPGEYADHLRSLPLGPNVVSMLGHSTARTHVMGLGRSLDERVRPSDSEMHDMRRLTEEAMEAGLLGLSINMLPWDKMGGHRFRSRSTPSVFAKFAEYRELADLVRRRDGVFQAIPNLQTRWSIGPLMDLSRPGRNRTTLRTSLLTLMDAPPTMGVYRLMGAAANLYNDRLGANVRFQALPVPFDLYTDGLENPTMEEFGAGTQALHLEDLDARSQLMKAPVYRRMFAQQWTNKIASRAYHRDLAEAWVVSSPDDSLAGKSFAELAAERGQAPVDMFLDLLSAYGNDLRWYTVVGNGRPKNLESIIAHPCALIGFSDAGAHLRNMAFYNFPLRMLKKVRDAELAGRPFMTIAAAVHKLTADIADFHRIDAGRIARGARADVVVLDPAHLDDTVEAVHEVPMPGFDDLRRIVRRNDDTVRAVFVNGRKAWSGGTAAADLGTSHHYGTFLPLNPN